MKFILLLCVLIYILMQRELLLMDTSRSLFPCEQMMQLIKQASDAFSIKMLKASKL